ncbi:MAG: nucleoside-triphosphatase [Calditrichia bacterium]
MPDRLLSPVLIVGRKNSGKTAYLEYLIRKMKEMNLSVGGILSVGEPAGGDKETYFLKNIDTGEKFLLASKIRDSSRSLKYGDYYFNPDSFARGSRIMKGCLSADAIILDEYGPVEQMGKGFSEALEFLLRHYRGFLFIAVRPVVLPHLKSVLLNNLGERIK